MPDNALGANLEAFAFLSELNLALANGISSGDITIILEHDGLNALSGNFVLNWWPGAWGPGMTSLELQNNPVEIDESAIQAGTQPRFYLDPANITGSSMTAGPGVLLLEMEVLGVPIRVPVRRATMSATMIAASSGVPLPGLDLVPGWLGGVVRVEDVYNAINAAASTCTCLGLGGQDLVDLNGTCNANANGQNCTNQGLTTCADIAGSCNVLVAVGLFADVDLDGDGLNDGVSVGAIWSALPAQIVGTVP